MMATAVPLVVTVLALLTSAVLWQVLRAYQAGGSGRVQVVAAAWSTGAAVGGLVAYGVLGAAWAAGAVVAAAVAQVVVVIEGRRWMRRLRRRWVVPAPRRAAVRAGRTPS